MRRVTFDLTQSSLHYSHYLSEKSCTSDLVILPPTYLFCYVLLVPASMWHHVIQVPHICFVLIIEANILYYIMSKGIRFLAFLFFLKVFFFIFHLFSFNYTIFPVLIFRTYFFFFNFISFTRCFSIVSTSFYF